MIMCTEYDSFCLASCGTYMYAVVFEITCYLQAYRILLAHLFVRSVVLFACISVAVNFSNFALKTTYFIL